MGEHKLKRPTPVDTQEPEGPPPITQDRVDELQNDLFFWMLVGTPGKRWDWYTSLSEQDAGIVTKIAEQYGRMFIQALMVMGTQPLIVHDPTASAVAPVQIPGNIKDLLTRH